MISEGALNTLFRRPLNDPLSSDQLTLPSLAAYARYYYKRKPQLAIMVTFSTNSQRSESTPVRPPGPQVYKSVASGATATLLYTTAVAVVQHLRPDTTTTLRTTAPASTASALASSSFVSN